MSRGGQHFNFTTGKGMDSRGDGSVRSTLTDSGGLVNKLRRAASRGVDHKTQLLS